MRWNGYSLLFRTFYFLAYLSFKAHHDSEKSASLFQRLQLGCLGGIFWLQLHEKLTFKALSHAVPGSGFGSAFYNSIDRFKTSNDFLAAELGLDARYQIRRWELKGQVKGALGATLQKDKLEGSSQTSSGNAFFLTSGTANEILPGGIFVEPSNRGTHKKNPLAWGFETRIQTGFEMAQNIKMHLGYSFLWINSVLRPGNQIDRKINSTRTALADASRETVGIGPGPIPFGGAPGPAPLPSGPIRPRVRFKSSPFWAQGLDFGIQFHL